MIFGRLNPNHLKHVLPSFSQIVVVTILISPNCAMTTAILSLQDCIDIAEKQNPGHLVNIRDVESSREQLRQARSEFALNIDASLDVPTYTESRRLHDNVALLQRVHEENVNMEYQGETTISQRFAHFGMFSVTASGIRNDFSSNRRQDRKEFVGDLRVDYTHDLITKPTTEIQLERAQLALSIGQSNLLRQKFQLEEQVTNTFFDLVQAIRELQIQQQRLAQSTAALDLSLRKFEVGLIPEVEPLRLKVEKLRAKAGLNDAQTQIDRRRDQLREMLGMNMDYPVDVPTNVDHKVISVDESRAVKIGLQRRTDLKEAKWSKRSSELHLQDVEQQLGPTAQLTSSFTLLGRGPKMGDVSSTFGRSFVTAGIRMELPLLDGGDRRGRGRQAEIDLEKSVLSEEVINRQVILEIREAVRNVNKAEIQIVLGREELEVAQRTYQVESSRFELGLTDSQALLEAQTTFTEASLNSLENSISYQRALTNLRVATMAKLSELSNTPND